MKLKVIAAIILSTLSINTFAYKVISEKTTHTKGFMGGFIHKEVISKKNVLQALVKAYDASGFINTYVKLQAAHSVNIINSSVNNQRYTYVYKLSCQQESESFEKTIELSPKEVFGDTSESYGAIIMQSNGAWPIIASTAITGAQEAYKADRATLKVN